MKTHRMYRTLAALVCCMLLATLGALPICAEEDLLLQNRAVAQAAKSALDELIEHYENKENATTKLPSNKTYLVIAAYQAEIDNLISSDIDGARTQDLSADISLLREKGELAAKLTWIAYLHGAIETETDADIVYEQYKSLFQIVHDLTEQEALASLSDNACILMNQTVFKQKINRLPQELSVAEVHVLDHLKQARIRIDATLSPDVDGEDYLTIYRHTKELIVLEQGRLAAKQEFSDVYDLLGLPSADKLSSLSTLSGILAGATSTAEINTLLLNAVQDRLQVALPEMGKHTAEYRQGLDQAMNAAVQAAGNDRIVSLTPYLDGSHASFPQTPFSLRAQIAIAKDRVEALQDPSDDPTLLMGILGEYVSSGGILDRCETREELDYEVMRASYRVDWARKKPLYLSKIEHILPASSNTLQLQVKSVYDSVDAAICALSMGENSQPTPDVLVNDGIRQLDDLVCQAEAEHFRISHADVLGKANALDVVRAQLEAAIEAFDRLSEQTQGKLQEEKAILGEHYKALIAHAILAYLNEDSSLLRQETFSLLLGRVTSLSAADARPSALRIEADESLIRAIAIDTLLDRYAQACGHSHYAQYDSDSVSLLQRIVQTTVDALIHPEKTSVQPTGSKKTVDEVLQTQLLELERRIAIAEIRLAADGSTLEKVKTLLNAASDSILQASEKSAVEEIRDATVFRIGAYRKADQMRHELDDLKTSIFALRALSNPQKQALIDSAEMQSMISACTQAENAPDFAALTSIASSFANEKQAFLIEVEEKALKAGVELALNEITAEAEGIRNQIKAFEHLTDFERTSYTERLDTVVALWKSGIQTPSITWELLDTQLMEIRESIKGILASAQETEQAAFRVAILADWQAQYARPEAYSDAHYSHISALFDEGKDLLKNTTGIDALNAVKATIEQRLASIPTRLDEAKAEANEMIQNTYEALSKKKLFYSMTAWESIEEIYENARIKTNDFIALSEIPSVLNIATDSCRQMQEVRLSHLYTHESALGENGALCPSYPNGYDPKKSGYWACLSAPDSIPFDSRFSITRFEVAHLTSSLQAAVRNKSITDANGEALSSALLSSLKNGIITDGLTLSYHATATPSSYLVSILLPAGYDTEGILGIVFMTDNGAEFYNVKTEGDMISFETSHLSDFYIVLKKTIDISPLILVLSIILLCEIVAILLILSKRKENAPQERAAAFVPIAPFAASVRITPQGGLVAVIILTVCITIATAVLIWLILDERARHLPAPVTAALSTPQQEPRELVLSEQALEIDSTAPSDLPSLYEPLPTVTAELANAMMSDEEVQKVKENAAARSVSPQVRHTGKKHAINIDVISKNFEAYDTVSLSALKKRGLIPQGAQAIKILARGTLDKPLTVVANDFSATAIKMILLTGGEVITAE